MNPRQNVNLEKNRQVREFGYSRIEQLKEELALNQSEEQAHVQAEDYDDDFIENDNPEDQETTTAHARKKILTNNRARVIVPANSSAKTDHLTNEQRQKRDEQSKAMLDSIVKEKLKDNGLEDAARLQNQFKTSNYAKQKEQRPAYQPTPSKEGVFERLLYSKFVPKISTAQIQQTKSLDFFLLDATEDLDNLSVLYLFGKVSSERQTINACVQLTNLMREIWVMPRRGFSVADVEQEIRESIANFKSMAKVDIVYSRETKKYCFEFDVDYRNEDVEVLKLSYLYKHAPLTSLSQVGRTYKGVFGVSTPPLEHFLIKAQIEGSSWLRLTDFEIVPQSTFSDQQLNIRMTDFQRCLTTSPQQLPVPPLSLMTFQLNINNDTRTIDAAYVSLYSSFNIEENRFEAVDYLMLHTRGFELKAEPKSDSHRVFANMVQDSEYMLLNNLQSLFSKLNPDIIVGHELCSGVMDIYLTKLTQVGVESLNLLSRCCVDPKRLRSISQKNLKNRMKNIFAGRLLLDTFLLAKEFLKLDEYSLSNIVAHLNKETGVLASQNLEIELRASAEHLREVLVKLQLLPLTFQLSKVAGCLWQTSLRQARAERNEILLLHKFFANNYILPDRQKFEKDDEEDEEKGYTGGLVLEPKSGFYDSYIVLVDFNSLYPSIIRHYKICFTTVNRQFKSLEKGLRGQTEGTHLEEEINNEREFVKPVNEIFLTGTNEPLLPQILSMLISKRKEVKNQMKREKNASMLRQLDIKQQAYKLIANSIYGCLGFSFSRFYTKKMAALITHFGRALLKNSEELISGQGYTVIYGDTDSLMINTLKFELTEAIATGLTLKQEINNQFKKNRDSREQILEVELDGVFKKLLLLKKKKYAALTVTNYMEIAQSRTDGVQEQTKLEIKGMDMIRRDWSKLTKDACSVVLKMLMSAGDLEEVYAYLEAINKTLNVIAAIDNPNKYQPAQSDQTLPIDQKNKSGSKPRSNGPGKFEIEEEGQTDRTPLPVIEIKDFIIKRQLNKKPSEYGDTSGQPHVRVAMWMKDYFKKNDEQLLNHFIPFVITTRGSALGEKAMHVEEYYSQFDDLSNDRALEREPKTIYPLDIHWYKNNQLLNPVHRMLEVIEGHTEERLKLIFELSHAIDAADNAPEEKKYSIYESISNVQADLPFIYKSLTTDIEEFKTKCYFCKQKCYAFLPFCPITVDGVYPLEVYQNRVTAMLNSLIINFYSFQKKCQECSYTTTVFKVGGSCCVHHEGKRMKALSSPKEISEKICYFRDLCLSLASANNDNGEDKIRRHIVTNLVTPVIASNYYESKNTLKTFSLYSNGNKDIDKLDLVKTLI